MTPYEELSLFLFVFAIILLMIGYFMGKHWG